MPQLRKITLELPEEKPWLRLKGETEKAYQAFQAYRRLGAGRTIREAYRFLNKIPKNDEGTPAKTPSWWSEWKRYNLWEDRCRFYDAMLHEKEVINDQRALEKDKANRRALLNNMMATSQLALQQWANKLQTMDPKKIDIANVVSLKDLANTVYGAIEQQRKENDEEPIHRIEQKGVNLQAHAEMTAEEMFGLSIDDMRRMDARTLTQEIRAGLTAKVIDVDKE